MIEKKFTIISERGLHFRPCSQFAEKANRYFCDIFVEYNGERYLGKTSMQLFSACVPQGGEITIICDGTDEKKAMTALDKLLKSFD